MIVARHVRQRAALGTREHRIERGLQRLQIVERLHGLDAAGQTGAAQRDACKTLVGG